MSKMLRRMRQRSADGDAGMTLPEVLITMVIMGTVMTALVGATTVILRQQDNSSGRLNNARSEQSVGIWLPSDLASAEDVVTEPGASPCGTQCPPGVNVGGSNALMLSWTGTIAGDTESIPTRTTVSYRYVQVGDEWQVIRVKCVSVNSAAPTCDQSVVLHNVLPPPPGQTWIPGTTSPVWVIVVRLALDPAIVEGSPEDTVPSDPTYFTKNGRRVTVTINGGGDLAGAGGGEDSITLSAGGTDRKPDLSTSNFSDPPSFGATRSRCGGNFAMLVDTSGSIGDTNMASVRTGITAFINAFAGTPIKLEIVRFSATSSTLGAGSGWSRYYDMLVESDVTDLKAQVTTLSSSGGTNWEDGMFRIFKNSDGSVQSVLPDTLIFFTDGMPTRNRLDATSATAPAAVDIDDIGLPASDGNNFHQVSWNRAWRIARDYYADVDRFIGVYVGSNVNASSTWRAQGAGYHLVDFSRGYHNTWDRGFHLENFQRGYNPTWSRGWTLTSPQRGYHLEYQRATSGIRYEKKVSGNWNRVEWNTGSSTTQYAPNNANNTEGDLYRTKITGTPGTWVTMTAVGSKSPATLYSQSNTNTNDSDGYRVVKVYTAPFDTYESVSESTLIAANPSLPATFTAGWTGTVSTSSPFEYWTATTEALYNSSNTTADDLDGWRFTKNYSSPYTLWETTTEALYTQYNTKSDNTDGWTATTVYGSPYTQWVATTASTYNSNNSTADALDGWRQNNVYTSPFSSWEATTEALYTQYNTTADTSDGWGSDKSYTQPYTFHEASTSYSRPNTAILAQIVSEGAVVPAIFDGTKYTNAEVADFYAMPNWDQFAVALNAMALAECGGTVTVQTKVGTASAADPFTYQNSVDLNTATTSSQFRSGTFDFDLSGGTSRTADITPLNVSGLSKYEPVSWSCKSAGADYPFTVTPISGSPWSKITLTVSPNQAISCVQTVRLK